MNKKYHHVTDKILRLSLVLFSFVPHISPLSAYENPNDQIRTHQKYNQERGVGVKKFQNESNYAFLQTPKIQPAQIAPLQKIDLPATFKQNLPNFKAEIKESAFTLSHIDIETVQQSRVQTISQEKKAIENLLKTPTLNNKQTSLAVIKEENQKTANSDLSAKAAELQMVNRDILDVEQLLHAEKPTFLERTFSGAKMVESFTLDDNTFLRGEIAVDKQGSIEYIEPGTTREIFPSKKADPNSKTVTIEAPKINGSLWTRGKMVWDRGGWQLAGKGTKIVKNYGNYDEIVNQKSWRTSVNGVSSSKQWLEVEVYNEEVLGVKGMMEGTQLVERESGLIIEMKSKSSFQEMDSITGEGGVWALAGNQEGKIKFQGENSPIKLNQYGTLDAPVKIKIDSAVLKSVHSDENRYLGVMARLPKAAVAISSLKREIASPAARNDGSFSRSRVSKEGNETTFKITAILPNIETGGWQIVGEVELKGGENISAEIPGNRPRQTLSSEITERRSALSARANNGQLRTEAKIRQEGDQCVLSDGKAGIALVTGADQSGNQQIISIEPVLSAGSQITITQKTEFPEHGVAIECGKAQIGSDGRITFQDGTIYKNQEGRFIFLKSFSEPVRITRLCKTDIFEAKAKDVAIADGYKIPNLKFRGKIERENGTVSIVNYPKEIVVEKGIIRRKATLEMKENHCDVKIGKISVKETVKGIFRDIATPVNAFLRDILFVPQRLLGMNFTLLSGDVRDKQPDFQFDTNPDAPAVLAVPGMNNEKYEIGSFVIEVQKIFGITHMAQIENRTHGKMVGDIVQTLGYEYLGAIDNHAINAAHAIRQGIAEKGEIYVVAHSQGTAIFERALALLKPEERSKIHYFGAGSEVFIDENKYGLASAVNVKNEGDKIPDMGNKWRITNWFIPSEWSRKGKLDWTNINVNAEGNHHSFLTYYINALKQWHNGEDIR